MKTKYLGSLIAFLTTLIIWGIAKTNAYQDIENNILFVILFFIVLTIGGGALAQLFEKKEDNNEETPII